MQSRRPPAAQGGKRAHGDPTPRQEHDPPRLGLRDSRLLQRHPPGIVPTEGGLDALSFKGTLVVAYAAALSTVVVASGSDLRTLELVSVAAVPRRGPGGIRAVAFRPDDCGLAIAIGGTVAVYRGWSAESGVLSWGEESRVCLAADGAAPFHHGSISTLSFSRNSRRLAVIGTSITVWECNGELQNWKKIFYLSNDAIFGSGARSLLSVGVISPDGGLVAAGVKFAQVIRVWRVESHWDLSNDSSDLSLFLKESKAVAVSPPPGPSIKRNYSVGGAKTLLSPPLTNLQQPSTPFAELRLGSSGVSSVSWKRRGGGQSVLLTSDCDGVLRLWAKIPRVTSHSPSGWMEEIARSPHVVGTRRGSAAFVDWGGGGGVAIDEADAAATAALYPFLVEGSVQKPSRTNHWLVSVSGGQTRAWRSRGLDDRPRAMYARLEPGSEETIDEAFRGPHTLASRHRHHAFLAGEILAIRSLAPEPLTASGGNTSELVKTYAISNNERRLRSEEPPEPPNVVVSFLSALHNGCPRVGRYDICPTSDAPSVCRARVGSGPRSGITDIQASAGVAESTRQGSVACSLGTAGDVFIWRIDNSSMFSPLSIAAELPGPWSSVTLPPISFAESRKVSYVVAASHLSSLISVFKIPRSSYFRDRIRSDKLPIPEKVASCVELKRIVRLQTMKMSSEELLLLGIFEDGQRLGGWKLSMSSDESQVTLKRINVAAAELENEILTMISSSDSGLDDLATVAIGTASGAVHIMSATLSGGTATLEQRRTLGKRTSVAGRVLSVTIGRFGLRVAAIRTSGTLTVWERNPSSGRWKREYHRSVIPPQAERCTETVGSSSMSFGADPMGDVYLAFSCPRLHGSGGLFLFVKRKGLAWSELSVFGKEEMRYPSGHSLGVFAPCLFIGSGVLLTSDGPSLLTYCALRGSHNELSSSGSLDYSRQKVLSAIIQTGGNPWQTVSVLAHLSAALEEGEKWLRNAGLEPPPLELLLSRRVKNTDELQTTDFAKIASLLREQRAPGLPGRAQQELICLLQACAEIRSKLLSLDTHGASFALAATSLLLDGASRAPLQAAVFAEALHSTSKDALVELLVCPPPPRAVESMWERLRRLGVGFWIESSQHAKSVAERVARHAFSHSGQDPDSTALWYICLGRRTALAALYRAKNNKRMNEFFSRDFSEEANRVAAQKNAYVLISKHRFELAAAFFALSGDSYACGHLLRTRLGDPQLALLSVRLLCEFGELRHLHSSSDEHSAVDRTLRDILEDSRASQDHHVAGLCLWMLGDHDAALQSAADSLEIDDVSVLGADVAGADLAAVLTLGHALAIASRPGVRGNPLAMRAIRTCRLKTASSLAAEGAPAPALAILFDVLESGPDPSGLIRKKCVEVTDLLLKHRAVAFSRASSGSGHRFYQSILSDLEYLSLTTVGKKNVIAIARHCAVELSMYDEVDAASTLALAAYGLEEDPGHGNVLDTSPLSVDLMVGLKTSPTLLALREVLVISSARSIQLAQASVLGVASDFVSLKMLTRFCRKVWTALRASKSAPLEAQLVVERMTGHLRRGMIILRMCATFLEGSWHSVANFILTLLGSTGSRDLMRDVGQRAPSSRDDVELTSIEDVEALGLVDEGDVESLRSLASSPSIRRSYRDSIRRGIRRSLTSDQFARISPVATPTSEVDIFSLHDVDAAEHSAPVATPSERDGVKERNPLLDAALGCAVFAAASSHLARLAEEEVQSSLLQSSQIEYRIHDAALKFESVAGDSLLSWVPHRPFGQQDRVERRSEVAWRLSSRAHARLWRLFASVGEFAPLLSESATVAAASEAFAAAEKKRASVVRTQHGALSDSYPVRFSTSSRGPWSGLGRHFVVYSQNGELIRSLTVSSSDPPVLTIATPRGILEIIPSSYVAQAGLPVRSSSPRSSFEAARAQGRRINIQKLVDQVPHGSLPREETALTIPAPAEQQRAVTVHASVWKHDISSSALAAHPYKRRYASGGADGVVRVWAYSEPHMIGELKLQHGFGRVASLCFSAYAEALLAVFVSGQIAVWTDPDHAAAMKTARAGHAMEAFGNRRASDAVFVDERHVVAAVGDPGGVTSAGAHAVGHSLRIFDMREPGAAKRATWTSRVHGGTEARCLSMMEDHVRIATGGVDGTLSIVDIRARACVAEHLPAHEDEICCMSVEQPRGRALVTGCSGGTIKLWDSRTLLSLDSLPNAHTPTRHFWSGAGIGGLVGTHGVKSVYLTDRALISAGGDGTVKIWGPGWGDFDHTIL